MGRHRSRSRSSSPRRSRSPITPRRKRYDDPRERYRDRRSYRDGGSSSGSGLLVRNISLDSRPEDLRIPFERFGPVKDVYLPKNYYTGEPRGFGFVKFRVADDAAEAKQQMNHTVIGGREITIVFAEENRKTPREMRSTGRVSNRYMGGGNSRRSPPRSPRRRYQSHSPSPSLPRHDSRDRDRGRADYYSDHRSISPPPRNERNHRLYRGSPGLRENSRSPVRAARSHPRSRSYSPT